MDMVWDEDFDDDDDQLTTIVAEVILKMKMRKNSYALFIIMAIMTLKLTMHLVSVFE